MLLDILYFPSSTCFVVQLSIVESSRGLIGDHDVPLQKFSLNVLEVSQHVGGRVGLRLNSSDESVDLLPVFLLGLDQLFLEKAEPTLHYY